jgi:NTP pyrophosphatase (non-canonical NTP hydrolase)
MNTIEHLLTCLGEEGAEIAHITSKAIRFGLHERWAKNPDESKPSNAERLIDELNDLLGVADMLVERGEIPANWMNIPKQEAKKEKVRKYMRYAKVDCGTLND